MRAALILLLLALIAITCVSRAQTSAAIGGSVTDSSGAVVPDASVSLSNIETGARREAVSSGARSYAIPPLTAGKYRLTVKKDGFKPVTRDAVTLTTGESLELNFTLELGAVSETVSVTATTSILETRNAETGQLVEAKTIEDMPLG